MNLSQGNRIDEINLDAVKGRAVIGSDNSGAYFLGGNASDHYRGLEDFMNYSARFGLGNALSADMQLLRKRINQGSIEPEKVNMVLRHGLMAVSALTLMGGAACYQKPVNLKPSYIYSTSTFLEGQDTLFAQSLDQDGDGRPEVITLMKMVGAQDRRLVHYAALRPKNSEFSTWEEKLSCVPIHSHLLNRSDARKAEEIKMRACGVKR